MAIVPAQARYEASTRTIRSVPGNHWLATADSWDGAIDHAATARTMAAALGFLHKAASLQMAGDFTRQGLQLAALCDEATALIATCKNEA